MAEAPHTEIMRGDALPYFQGITVHNAIIFSEEIYLAANHRGDGEGWEIGPLFITIPDGFELVLRPAGDKPPLLQNGEWKQVL